MHLRMIGLALACGVIAACASSGPKQFGQYNEIAPRVALQPGERLPRRVTVQLARPANVAVFLVMPGRGSTLLFPADSTQSGYVEAGSHLVETSFRRVALADSARGIKHPTDRQNGVRPAGERSRGSRDSLPGMGFNEHGFLLIYASESPMPYHALATRVSGISIPIEDTDALNTVTKLIRSTTSASSPWAAYATDFRP